PAWLSVIIPTRNEARAIAALVHFVRQQAGPALADVWVVDANSADRTAEHAEAAGARVLSTAVASRAQQMNLGARHARGLVLYFVHADVQLRAGFVADIAEAVRKGSVAGCYRYVFDSPRLMLKVNAYFTRFDSIMCRGGDQTLFVVRQVFESLGGFNEQFVVMEDYDFLLRLRKQHAFVIIPKDIIVSARKYHRHAWLWVQMANLTAFILFFLRVSPSKIKLVYRKFLPFY
ncbi:MAG: TIGR04283 family arsenosugar biosynthesis glycosyltransferase, partial [Bacteroidota bacterium]